MTQQDAAKSLGVSIRTLQRYVKDGKLSVSYAPGKTRLVAVYDDAEIAELRTALFTRPVYPQSKHGSPQIQQKRFSLHLPEEDLERLSTEAEEHGMNVSAYARLLVRMGLEGALQHKIGALQGEVGILHKKIAGLEQTLDQFHRDFSDAFEIVFEFGGMSLIEAEEWVDTNLRTKKEGGAK